MCYMFAKLHQFNFPGILYFSGNRSSDFSVNNVGQRIVFLENVYILNGTHDPDIWNMFIRKSHVLKFIDTYK